MSLLLRKISFCVFTLAVCVTVGADATACDLCRRTSLSLVHDSTNGATQVEDATFLGGDNFGDASAASLGSDSEVGLVDVPLYASAAAAAQSCPDAAQGWSHTCGSQVTLTYSYQNLFHDDDPSTPQFLDPNDVPLPDLLIRKSIEEALGLWAKYAPLRFVEVEDDSLQYGQSNKFGQIRFKLGRINGRDPELGAPAAKALASFPGSSNGSGDVTFDYEDRWQEIGTLRQPDILGAATHEIGHALGLRAHSTVTIPGEFWTYFISDGAGGTQQVMEPMGGAVMYWIFPRFTGLGSGMLFPDDINRVQRIYGAGVGSVTPLLRVPEPTTLAMTAVIALATLTWSRRRIA